MKIVTYTRLAALLICLSNSVAVAQESFETYEKKALRGDYGAQRNAAFCLRTAECEGVIASQPMKACVWRMVILGSGHREVDASDIANYRLECFSKISQQERAVALTQAEVLFRRIYKRDLPLDVLMR